MSATFAVSLLVFLAIVAGVYAWSIHAYGRVNRHVAGMLESGRTSWDGWRSAVLLDGVWNGMHVRIRSIYIRPPRLSVTLRVATRPPDLEASLNRSGRIEFRSLRFDRRLHVLARVVEDEAPKPGPASRAAIHTYFTPARVHHLRVLLTVLEWERFWLDQEGIGVSRLCWESARWNRAQARNYMLSTLVELQSMGGH